MYESRFSVWLSWRDRNDHTGLKYPGVYVIAHSSVSLSGAAFSWCPEVIYIGMTNATTGLRGRLRKFDDTIAGKRGHGGADRVRYKHRSYKRLCQRLYVAVAVFKCDVTSGLPADLRVMGRVAQFEYDCFAHFVELFEKLPEFNDRKHAPKFSHEE